MFVIFSQHWGGESKRHHSLHKYFFKDLLALIWSFRSLLLRVTRSSECLSEKHLDSSGRVWHTSGDIYSRILHCICITITSDERHCIKKITGNSIACSTAVPDGFRVRGSNAQRVSTTLWHHLVNKRTFLCRILVEKSTCYINDKKE